MSSRSEDNIKSLKTRIQELESKLEDAINKKDELLNIYRSIDLLAKNANALYTINDFDINCTFRYVSPSVKKIAGYEPEEMIGKSAFDYIHPKDKKNILIPLLKTYLEYRTKKILRGELKDRSETFYYRCRDKWGKWRNVETTGNLVGDQLIMVTTDFGEQKEWEAKVKQSQVDFNNLLTNLNDIYFKVDSNGMVSDINPIIEKIAGFKPNEVIGEPVSSVFRNDMEFQKFIQDIKTTGSLNDYDMILLRKDGSDIHVSANVYVIRDEDGNQLGVEGILRDNTERKKTEIILRENERNRSFLAYSAIELSSLTSIDQVCDFTADSLYELIGQEGFITIVEFDKNSDAWKMICIRGVNSHINKISKILGENIREIQGKRDKNNYKYLKTGKLTKVTDDLYNLVHMPISKSLINMIIKLFKIRDIYVIPFKKDTTIYGNLSIVTNPNTRKINKDIIETFISQISNLIEKIRTQEELKRSEIRYKTLYESSKQAVVLLSESGDKFIEGNKEFLKLIKIKSKKDLIKLTPGDISPEYQPDGQLSTTSSINHINTALKNGSDYFEWIHRRTDNKDLICTVLLTRYIIDNVKFLQAVVTDISERKEAETLLKESEEKFSKSFQSSPYLVGITTLDGGRYVDVNNAFLKTLGFTRNEVIGRTSKELGMWLNFNYRKSMKEIIEKKGKIKDKEVDIKTRSGESLIGLLSAEKIFLKGIPHIIASIQDITEKKHAEEALQTSEERFRLITDLTSDLAYAFKVHKNGKFTHLWSTGPIEKLTGYHAGEITEMGGWGKIIVKEDLPKISTQIEYLLNKKNVTIDYRIVKKNGDIIWVKDYARPIIDQDSGKVVKFYGSINEITYQKIAEIELQESQKKYQDLYDNAPDMYFSVSPQGTILSVNEFGANYLGYSKEELIGKSIWIVVFPDDLGMVKTQVSRIIETKLGTNDLEFRKIRKNGSILYVQERIQCIVDDKGDCIELRINCRDVTENKIAQKKIIDYQQNLKSLSNALIVAEEMERKRLAITLHDTIGQLLAMSNIKLSNFSNRISSEEYKTEIKSIKDLIADAIKESRDLTYELSPPILHELGLFAACKWYIEQLKSNNGIEIMINGDESRYDINDEIKILVFRAIRELLNNVLKHASASQIELTLKREKDFIKATVQDDGKGFEVDDLRKKSIEGKKFGLFSISERIEYLGGSFQVRSKEKKGTVVTIIVPI